MRHNKNVISQHQNPYKSVKECFYGTIYFEKAAGLEEFPLP